jgi:hypothetical protein
MILDKVLTKEQQHELFEEQKAVFSNSIVEGEKYRPRADFYAAGCKVATLIYPAFENKADMARRFHQAAWFPKVIRADESILFLDVTTEVVNKTTSIPMESDVFMCLKTSPQKISHEASPYYMNPDVEHPVWNHDYELTEENVFSLSDIIASLNFAITDARHNLNSEVLISYLEANGFEIDFHFPFTSQTFMAVENEIYF